MTLSLFPKWFRFGHKKTLEKYFPEFFIIQIQALPYYFAFAFGLAAAFVSFSGSFGVGLRVSLACSAHSVSG